MTSNTRIVAHNTLFQLGGRSLTVLVSFALTPLLTRFLQPSLYGDYSLVLALNSILIALSEFGIHTIAIREAAKNPEDSDIYAKQTFVLRVASALIFSIISSVLVLAGGYSDPVKIGFIIVASSVLVQAVQAAYQVILQARLKVYLVGLADVISRIMAAAIALVVIMSSAQFAWSREVGLQVIFLGPLVGAVLALVMLAVVTKYNFYRTAFSWTQSREILRDALPLGLVTILGIIHYRADTVILSIFKDSFDVGIYNLAYKFLDLSLVFPSFLLASVYPLLSMHQGDHEKFRQILQRAFDILVLAGVAVAFGTFVIAEPLISLFGGEDYTQSVLPLKLLSFALIFSFINSIFLYGVILKNEQRKILLISAVTVFLNLGINLILIPAYSYNGAATATLLTELLGMAFMIGLFVSLYRYNVKLGNFFKILLSGLVMLAVLLPLQQIGVVPLVFLGGVVYLSMALLLRVLDVTTIKEIMRIR